METISIKIDEAFARDVEKFMKKYHYTTKTEFIREAMREEMNRKEKENTLKLVRKYYGFSKHKTTDKQLHAAREKAGKELERELGLSE